VDLLTGKHRGKQAVEMAKIAMLLFFSALAGCSSIFIQSVEDTREDVPRARLRVVSDEHGITRGFPESDCYDESIPGFGNVTVPFRYANSRNNHSLGMPNPERITESLFAEIYIEAEKPFTLQYLIQGLVQCSVAVSFVPQEDKNYEIRARTIGRQCMILLSTLTEDGLWVPPPRERATSCASKWKINFHEWLVWKIWGRKPTPKEHPLDHSPDE
jgi:hypothetical protein